MAIMSAYRANVGASITAPLAWLIGKLYSAGMDADVIVHAIEVTGYARRPSPWYLKAVLARYEEQRLFTMGDVLHDEDMYRGEKDSQDLPW